MTSDVWFASKVLSASEIEIIQTISFAWWFENLIWGAYVLTLFRMAINMKSIKNSIIIFSEKSIRIKACAIYFTKFSAMVDFIAPKICFCRLVDLFSLFLSFSLSLSEMCGPLVWIQVNVWGWIKIIKNQIQHTDNLHYTYR